MGLRPIKTKSGRVTAEPLEATVFKKPHSKPPTAAITSSIGIV
jgi:hypothetical protein